MTAHLTDRFSTSSKPFQKILDCVGSDELFRKCGGYLDKNGIFITIVGGVGAGPIARSKLLPVSLGGVPRKFKLLALWPDGAIAKEVVKWIESGDYHTFPVDSEYSMEEAVKVGDPSIPTTFLDYITKSHYEQGYEKVASKRSRGKVIVKICD